MINSCIRDVHCMWNTLSCTGNGYYISCNYSLVTQDTHDVRVWTCTTSSLEGPDPRHDHPKMSWSGWVVGGDTQSVNMHVLYDYHKGNQGTFHVHVCGMNGIPTESHHS